MEFPGDVMNRLVRKFAKGLYLHNTGKRLPENAELSFDYTQSDFEKLMKPYKAFLPSARVKCFGSDIVCYWWLQAADDPLATVTYLVFYRWIAFLVITRPPEQAPSTPELSQALTA
jgi:hypothetical protein